LNEDNMVTPVNLKGLSSFFSIDTKYMWEWIQLACQNK
jgi:hypothetical protein